MACSENVSIPKSRFRRPRKIFAFVDLASAAEAQKALETLNETLMQDRKVSVKLANPIIPKEKSEKKVCVDTFFNLSCIVSNYFFAPP